MATQKEKKLNEAQLKAAAQLFNVLSEPTRLKLLNLLQAGEKTVGELVTLSGLGQANVSKQLGILHEAKLVERHREGNFIRYAIADVIVFDLCQLVCGKIQKDAQSALQALTK